jgi:glucokinase
MKSILAADIGGTNSRFAMFRKPDGAPLSLVASRWLPTKDADSFAELLAQLANGDFPLTPETADVTVIGAAGPVQQGTYCNPPNIAWDINLARPQDRAGAPRMKLINDFVAQAYACRSPIGQAARAILPGEPMTDGTIGVLGAGTALGKAILVSPEDAATRALPSEGGHGYFPFIGEREYAFQQFYQKHSGQHHITGNLVVSGRGLRYLHWFLSGDDLPPEQVAARFAESPETLAWAARFYGRACRDFALEVLALGGLYIAGGVAAKSPAIVTHEEFRREFTDSPTMGHLLSRLPVYLLENEESGLWGAAYLGELSLRQG